MAVELNTLSPKKWVADYSGAAPTIDTTDGVRVGDFAIDTSTAPDRVWLCTDNTDTAPVWWDVTAASAGGTKEFYIGFQSPNTMDGASRNLLGTNNEWVVWEIGSGEDLYFTFACPADFTSLTSAHLVCIPDATEDMQWDIAIAVSADGEDLNNDLSSALNQTQAVTQNELTEVDINSGTPFANMVADDYVGVHLVSDKPIIRFIGFRMIYA